MTYTMLGHSSRAFPNGASPPPPPPPSTSTSSAPPPLPEEKHSDNDSFQEFLNELDEKHKGQPPPEEAQAALLHSFERARQEPNDSTTVYGIEDADLKDGKGADLEDDEDADREDADLSRTPISRTAAIGMLCCWLSDTGRPR
jgi:hypothetical protein